MAKSTTKKATKAAKTGTKQLTKTLPLKPAKPAKPKSPTWSELNKSYAMLDTLTTFLANTTSYHNAPKYSKNLIKKIAEEWATAATKDSKQKHKAPLIKAFGDFVSSV